MPKAHLRNDPRKHITFEKGHLYTFTIQIRVPRVVTPQQPAVTSDSTQHLLCDARLWPYVILTGPLTERIRTWAVWTAIGKDPIGSIRICEVFGNHRNQSKLHKKACLAIWCRLYTHYQILYIRTDRNYHISQGAQRVRKSSLCSLQRVSWSLAAIANWNTRAQTPNMQKLKVPNCNSAIPLRSGLITCFAWDWLS